MMTIFRIKFLEDFPLEFSLEMQFVVKEKVVSLNFDLKVSQSSEKLRINFIMRYNKLKHPVIALKMFLSQYLKRQMMTLSEKRENP